MALLLSLLVGALVTSGIYMLLRRSIVDLVFGLMLLSHAANVLVFSMGGIVRAAPPLLGHGSPELMTDPLPQALVLTAIVIGFGLTAFTLVLVAILCGVEKTDDSEEMPTS